MREGCDSERAYVGAILNGYAKATDSKVQPDMFTDPLSKKLFTVCLTLEKKGMLPDLVTIFDSGKFSDIEISEIINCQQEASVESALVQQHEKNIVSACQRRRVTNLLAKSTKDINDKMQDVSTIISAVKAALEMIDSIDTTTCTVSGDDALIELYERYDKKKKGTENLVRTGLPSVDKRIGGGFSDGKMIVIGARPGVGKSALLSFFAVDALKRGKRILFISLEMPEWEVVGRMVSLLSNVSSEKISYAELSDEELWKTMEPSVTQVINDNLQISTKDQTPDDIRRDALKMVSSGGLDAIFVDYLQLMTTKERANNRNEAVGEISRKLKSLALELKIPVIAAAQVNRGSTIGAERPPQMSELRESGSIEQDADVIFLMHCPSEEKEKDVRKVYLDLAKNRQGKIGVKELMFSGETMRFSEIENRYS